MFKQLSILMLLSITFILVACGDKELSREEVIEKIEENYEEVESYNTFSSFDIRIKDANGHSDESYASMDLTVIESTNEIKAKVEEKGETNTAIEEYYITEDMIYSSPDGNTWSSSPSNDNYQVKESVSITYGHLFDVFETIEDELEFRGEDDYYLFSFNDTSQTIFDALDEPYNAYVTGIREDEINHEVELKVDKDHFYFIEFQDNMSGDISGNKLKFDIVHTFSDVNEIDELEVPDEVVNYQ